MSLTLLSTEVRSTDPYARKFVSHNVGILAVLGCTILPVLELRRDRLRVAVQYTQLICEMCIFVKTV